MKKLYTAKEMAKILSLAVPTIYQLGKRGELETVKVGKTVRFFLPKGVVNE